jgi:hypothetical protein
MVAHLDNGKNGLKFQIIGILRFPSIFYQAWSGAALYRLRQKYTKNRQRGESKLIDGFLRIL